MTSYYIRIFEVSLTAECVHNGWLRRTRRMDAPSGDESTNPASFGVWPTSFDDALPPQDDELEPVQVHVKLQVHFQIPAQNPVNIHAKAQVQVQFIDYEQVHVHTKV